MCTCTPGGWYCSLPCVMYADWHLAGLCGARCTIWSRGEWYPLNKAELKHYVFVHGGRNPPLWWRVCTACWWHSQKIWWAALSRVEFWKLLWCAHTHACAHARTHTHTHTYIFIHTICGGATSHKLVQILIRRAQWLSWPASLSIN